MIIDYCYKMVILFHCRNIDMHDYLWLGILLIFSSNQTATQIVNPYPPFGLVRITILTTAANLMLLGIYNSATLVSANNEWRRSIRKHALELRLSRCNWVC